MLEEFIDFGVISAFSKDAIMYDMDNEYIKIKKAYIDSMHSKTCYLYRLFYFLILKFF